MDFNIIFCLLCATILGGVVAEKGNEIKRGQYPYMAFVFYPDNTVLESNGKNFARAAIIIKPQWLVSAAIDPILVGEAEVGFPTRTLMARAGAVAIDADATLNEEENEQEREVITLVRPKARDLSKWWLSDVTLLQTLSPFVASPAVAVAPPAASATNGTCFILVYARASNSSTEDKVLRRVGVELLAPAEACGTDFDERRMACGALTAGAAVARDNADFCLGNAGGPLVCDSDVVGLQNYNLDTKCRQPLMFQMLVPWESFISCGTGDQPDKSLCADKLEIIYKDEAKPAAEKQDASAATLVTELLPTTENFTTVATVLSAEVNDSSSTYGIITSLEWSDSATTVEESKETVVATSPTEAGELDTTTISESNSSEVPAEGLQGNSSSQIITHITSLNKSEEDIQRRSEDNQGPGRDAQSTVDLANWSSKCRAEGLVMAVCLAIIF